MATRKQNSINLSIIPIMWLKNCIVQFPVINAITFLWNVLLTQVPGCFCHYSWASCPDHRNFWFRAFDTDVWWHPAICAIFHFDLSSTLQLPVCILVVVGWFKFINQHQDIYISLLLVILCCYCSVVLTYAGSSQRKKKVRGVRDCTVILSDALILRNLCICGGLSPSLRLWA